MLISIVIPAFREVEHISETVSTVRQYVQELQEEIEFILVDDGSDDGTWSALKELAASEGDVKALRFSRNFGKEMAIHAGLAHSDADAVIVMDADLQHPPSLIAEMIERWKTDEDIKVVNAVKTERGREGAITKYGSKIFSRFYAKLIGIDLKNASDFKLLDREVAQHYAQLSERNLFFRGMVPWLGYKSATVGFEVQNRIAGKTKWSVAQLFQLALNAISSFSTVPLQFVTIAGVVSFVVSVVMGIQTFLKWMNGDAVEGFTTVILLLLIHGSILMVSLGIIGQYIAKIYQEIKKRPHYLISEKAGFKA